MTMDFLDGNAFKPGEFEKLQELYNRAVDGLAKELEGTVEATLRREIEGDVPELKSKLDEGALHDEVKDSCSIISQLAINHLFDRIARSQHKNQPVSLNEQMLPGIENLDKTLEGQNFSFYGAKREDVVAAMERYMHKLQKEFYKDFSPIEFGTQLFVVPSRSSLAVAFILHASRKSADKGAREEKKAFSKEAPKF
jgi:hypothetical protein